MGKRGPAKQPTSLRVLNGNPGKRPLPVNEPKPKPTTPKCPAWLDTEAKRLWRELAPQLNDLGLLTCIDGAAFAAACQSWATYVECERTLKKTGRTMTVFTKSGESEQQRPEVLIGRHALLAFKSFCQEFGLTPSSRAGIDVSKTNDDMDPMEALLGGGGRG